MRRIRAYQNQSLQPGMLVSLDARVSHHWLRVLRLQSGAEVTLFNGDGRDYPGQMQISDKRSCSVTLAEPVMVSGNLQPRLRLLQGLARGERMDWVVQKATELGVDEILPLQCQHSQLQLRGARLDQRLQHWQQIIISACEQSGRASLPQLLPVQTVATAVISDQVDELRLLLHPGADKSLSALMPVNSDLRVQLAVGPEGGFSDDETAQCRAAGFVEVSLGNNILRTETAAVAAVALVKLAAQ